MYNLKQKPKNFIGDLDIIGTDFSDFNIDYQRYDDSQMDYYVGSNVCSGVTVDMFEKEGLPFVIYKDIKVSMPLDIIRHKVGVISKTDSYDRYGNEKHYRDLEKIFKYLK